MAEWPQKLIYPLKRDHFKRKGLSSIIVQTQILGFWGGTSQFLRSQKFVLQIITCKIGFGAIWTNLLLPHYFWERRISTCDPGPNLHLTPFLKSKQQMKQLRDLGNRHWTFKHFPEVKGNAWFRIRHCWHGLYHVPPDFRRWDDRPWRKYLVEHIESRQCGLCGGRCNLRFHFGQSISSVSWRVLNLTTALLASCWCLWSRK